MLRCVAVDEGELLLITLVGYTGVFNVLDYSSVSFPTGLVADKELDISPQAGPEPLSETCAAIRRECKSTFLDLGSNLRPAAF